MSTKNLRTGAAIGLSVTVLALFGCNAREPVVEAERDPDTGAAEVRVDGEQLERNVEQAQEGLKQAGQQLQEGAEQMGDAVQREAERVEREVGPVAREVLSDASITARVKAKLMADPEVNALHIDVDTVDGQVTLNGKVAREDQKEEAHKLASRTDGVKKVNNLIQVAGQETAEPDASR